MTAAGWAFMLCSTILVTTAMLYCFYRVLRKPAAAKHTHAPLDLDTHDRGA